MCIVDIFDKTSAKVFKYSFDPSPYAPTQAKKTFIGHPRIKVQMEIKNIRLRTVTKPNFETSL